MKILLISDTHGKLDVINELAAAAGADCCLHMGDLCLYTAESVRRFSADMLYKQLRHNPQLPPEQLAALDRNDAETMRQLALEYRTYGTFEDYLSGKKRFDIPVYAVPGNNDDAEIIACLEKHPISNLTFLDEAKQLEWEGFLICGTGGDIAGHAPDFGFGCVSTEAQVAKLEARLTGPGSAEQAEFKNLKKILLTHVPPYENERLMRALERIKPVLCLCGHTHHWDDRTVGVCRIITLPRPGRGYAVLELNNGQWNCQLYKNEVIT